jgi:ribonuclease BN (tRNA processing enzyme)
VTSLRLRVLGAGPAYTNRPGSSGAAYLVQTAATSVLLDLGQGSFPRLAAAVEPSTLDAVVVTHLHPDHFIDLVPLRHYLAFQFRPPRRLRVIGPDALRDRIDALHAQPGFAATTLDFAPFPGRESRVAIGDLELIAAPVAHTPESHALRIAAVDRKPRSGSGSGFGPHSIGRGLVYSGDCGRAEDLDPLIQPGDALLVEVSFGVGPVPPGAMHLDAGAIAGLVQRTNPGLVLLTHLQMGFDADDAVAAVQRTTTVQVRLVEPGDDIELFGT